MKIVIPMAGKGKTFKDAGYTFPKPLIDIDGKPMIQIVVENLNLSGDFIFLVQKEHYNKYSIKLWQVGIHTYEAMPNAGFESIQVKIPTT